MILTSKRHLHGFKMNHHAKCQPGRSKVI